MASFLLQESLHSKPLDPYNCPVKENNSLLRRPTSLLGPSQMMRVGREDSQGLKEIDDTQNMCSQEKRTLDVWSESGYGAIDRMFAKSSGRDHGRMSSF